MRYVIIGLVVVLAVIDFRAARHADKIIAPPGHFDLATGFRESDRLEKATQLFGVAFIDKKAVIDDDIARIGLDVDLDFCDRARRDRVAIFCDAAVIAAALE